MYIQRSCNISNACDQLNYTYIYVKLYIYLLRIKHIFTCISLFVVLIEWSMIYPHALIYMNGEDWAVVGIPLCGKQSKTLKLFLVHIDSLNNVALHLMNSIVNKVIAIYLVVLHLSSFVLKQLL